MYKAVVVHYTPRFSPSHSSLSAREKYPTSRLSKSDFACTLLVATLFALFSLASFCFSSRLSSALTCTRHLPSSPFFPAHTLSLLPSGISANHLSPVHNHTLLNPSHCPTIHLNPTSIAPHSGSCDGQCCQGGLVCWVVWVCGDVIVVLCSTVMLAIVMEKWAWSSASDSTSVWPVGGASCEEVCVDGLLASCGTLQLLMQYAPKHRVSRADSRPDGPESPTSDRQEIGVDEEERGKNATGAQVQLAAYAGIKQPYGPAVIVSRLHVAVVTEDRMAGWVRGGRRRGNRRHVRGQGSLRTG